MWSACTAKKKVEPAFAATTRDLNQKQSRLCQDLLASRFLISGARVLKGQPSLATATPPGQTVQLAVQVQDTNSRNCEGKIGGFKVVQSAFNTIRKKRGGGTKCSGKCANIIRFTPPQLYYCYSYHFYVYSIADYKKSVLQNLPNSIIWTVPIVIAAVLSSFSIWSSYRIVLMRSLFF